MLILLSTLLQMQALDSRGRKVIPKAMIYLSFVILAVLLLTLAVIDLKTFRLPNVLTFTLIGTGLAEAWILRGGFSEPFYNRLIGAGLGYGTFFLIEHGFKAIRGKDGLGRGDAKLLAGGGAWCGWFGLPFIVLIGSGMGLVAALFPSFRKSERIPFGPFLALGIMSVWAALNIQSLQL